ncbi:EGF domain-specific O-linked N-acetylglucosamine transferase isoform X3 [Hippocampus comes]|uniref:EGF domain-specific O-linked N-acetylglucosamine transferase isoform X3 n=1 Tax=Hippocampus comes TaxID=109280 RepID=UPI00094ED3C2|nr:PREDICTED: EGF domain-specific O-linked N-acetylglucosamine transferase isoform X3 [Hippocampus comes]
MATTSESDASLRRKLSCAYSNGGFASPFWPQVSAARMPTCVILAALLLAAAASLASENRDRQPPAAGFNYSSISLAPEHIPYFLYNNKEVAEQCRLDPLCPFQHFALLNLSSCWGYEKNCDPENRFSYPDCNQPDSGWVDSVEAARDLFWKQADFGYVKERRSELQTLCEAIKPGDSSLRCTSHARFCQATGLYLDLRKPRRGHERYQEDFIQKGEIGGHCRLNERALAAAGQHKSPLQSWYAELQSYTELDFHPFRSKSCDIVIEKPTVFMKLDAGVNMYHHFCDFVNLYISQHINNSFSSDINIIMWDTVGLLQRRLLLPSTKNEIRSLLQHATRLPLLQRRAVSGLLPTRPPSSERAAARSHGGTRSRYLAGTQHRIPKNNQPERAGKCPENSAAAGGQRARLQVQAGSVPGATEDHPQLGHLHRNSRGGTDASPLPPRLGCGLGAV